MENECATVLPINPPKFSGWNSGRVDLNELLSSCMVTPTMVGYSSRLEFKYLNLNTLLTTRLVVLCMKYFPKASVGSV